MELTSPPAKECRYTRGYTRAVVAWLNSRASSRLSQCRRVSEPFRLLPPRRVGGKFRSCSVSVMRHIVSRRTGHDLAAVSGIYIYTYVIWAAEKCRRSSRKKAARVEWPNRRKLLRFPVLSDPETPSPWRAHAWFDAPPSTCSFSFDAGRAALTHSNWSTLTPADLAPGAA